MVFSNCSDAYVALGRIGAFLTTEELEEPYLIAEDSKYAVQINGDFTWESVQRTSGVPKDPPKEKSSKKTKQRAKPAVVLPVVGSSETETEVSPTEDEPFELRNLKLKVCKGAFIAIVGRVGSGKSSLLQSMVGEMRKTRGEVYYSLSTIFKHR
jgi:ABC-type transport system involved in cytochrome bd biosynthesis fused ATPase/permease subunit